LFIQGYYVGGGYMQPTVYNELLPSATGAEVDTIFIELHEVANPTIIAETQSAILMVDGTVSANFNGTITGNTFWIAIRHRNAIQTWSSSSVVFAPTTSYDFTTSQSNAYGSNMVQVDFGPDYYAFWSGDINQDLNVDLLDFPDMDYGINNGIFGYYASDLNGDGNVDLLDFPFLDYG